MSSPQTTASEEAAASGAQLVVFDLDGTITRHDTLVPYVFGFLWRRPWRFAGLPRVLPALLRFLLRRAGLGEVKGAFIRSTLGGCTRAELQAWTERFVPRLLERGVFAHALEAIAQHRRDGDRLVLMSASPELYVPEIARRLGFDECICTRLRWNGDRLHGELDGENCRGDEKTRCFRLLRERHTGMRTVAYANGPSDLDHLELADRAVLVNGEAWTRVKASERGIQCADWR
ncbi:MAG: HAD-IB family hydrolase [Pseudomonadota bacterium]|jgi:HAD-superfamily subfamily IB hydrolase, TIGR01490|nr:MAG: hypothetical protein DIU56_16720 [Pseudomonadota bacterium]